MRFMTLNKTRKCAFVIWKSLVGGSDLDRGYDPYEREPVTRSEPKPRNFATSGFGKHHKLAKLRDIINPPNHV